MKFFKRADLIILAAAAAACIVCALLFTGVLGGSSARGGEGDVYADIYYQSELVQTVDLSTARAGDFSLPQLPQVVFRVYSNHSIAFIQSDCPDQICVKTGKLSKPGQFAACLPNQVLVKLVSSAAGGGDGPDIVIQ